VGDEKVVKQSFLVILLFSSDRSGTPTQNLPKTRAITSLRKALLANESHLRSAHRTLFFVSKTIVDYFNSAQCTGFT
jgi:hypothetical protein